MSFYPEYGKSLNQFQKDSSYSISSFICSVCSSAKNNFPGSRTRIGLGHGLERNYNSADLKSKCNFIKNCNMAGFDAYATAAKLLSLLISTFRSRPTGLALHAGLPTYIATAIICYHLCLFGQLQERF
jgi:hypothetical protein